MRLLSEDELKTLQSILEYHQDPFGTPDQQALMSCLKDIQSSFGYIPRQIQPLIVTQFGSTESVLKSIIHRFPNLKDEEGPITILICNGAECSKKGAHTLIADIKAYLKIQANGVSADGKYELRTQNCLRRCALGKNLNIDTTPYQGMTFTEFTNVIKLHETPQ